MKHKKFLGPVVQLVRIFACHARGREFESRPDRQEAQHLLGFFVLKDLGQN